NRGYHRHSHLSNCSPVLNFSIDPVTVPANGSPSPSFLSRSASGASSAFQPAPFTATVSAVLKSSHGTPKSSSSTVTCAVPPSAYAVCTNTVAGRGSSKYRAASTTSAGSTDASENTGGNAVGRLSAVAAGAFGCNPIFRSTGRNPHAAPGVAPGSPHTHRT